MNARILALIKNPELFQSQDLDILNAEIKKHPYMQSIRALYLFGVHQFAPETYQNTLSITAAYTTDKKILYQLIKGNTPEPDKSELNIDNQSLKEEKAKEVFSTSTPVTKEGPKPVYVNGELNRILFEGEENFLNEKHETIDLESTLESGHIVTQRKEPETEEVQRERKEKTAEKPAEPVGNESLKTEEAQKETTGKVTPVDDPHQKTDALLTTRHHIAAEKEIKEEEHLSPETILEKVDNSPQTDVPENPSEISFQDCEEFFSNVKIAPKSSESAPYRIPDPQPNKYEMEMQRLIAEVEAKMKASRQAKREVSQEEISNTEVNFSETQHFDVTEPAVAETQIAELPLPPVEKPAGEAFTETFKTTTSSNPKEWKPMSFSGNTPDAFIGKTEATPEEKSNTEGPKAEEEPLQTLTAETAENQEERPVFNVSFFSQNVAPIEPKTEKPVEEPSPKTEVSNVPTFITTWQNWLKIDRSKIGAPKNPVSKAEIKNTVIENFIVKEPKISKFKEESDFVVKEKSDNISHLMTETLAKLYVEQKLYSKAVKAYEILSEKHPEKKAHFAEQIKYIKDLRQNK